MAHGQGATSGKTPRSRGAYGSTRGKERQRRRADARERDPRYKAAMEETRKAQAALDALIEHQKTNPAMGQVEGALYDAELKAAQEAAKLAAKEQKAISAQVLKDQIDADAKKLEEIEAQTPAPESEDEFYYEGYPTRKLPQEGEGESQFAITTAQMMLRAQYHIKYVIESTGVGYKYLQHIPLDKDGYGWPTRDEDIEAEEEAKQNESKED